MKDYYEILGLKKDADKKAIKDAFRSLARQYHPDVNQDKTDAEDKFKEINNAYSVLGDPEKRQAYDRGSINENGDVIQDPFVHFGGFQNATHHSFFDPFNTGVRFHEPRQYSPNTDIESTLILDPDGSFQEQSTKIQYQRHKFCEDCNGDGGKNGRIACPDCNGQKFVSIQYNQNTIINTPCTRCQQRGFIFNQVCNKCHGFGVIEETANYNVKIPVGTYFKKLRIPGGGNQSNNKYDPGDLLIVILPPSPYKGFQFTNDGTTYLELLLDPIEAIIGTEKEVIDIKGEKVKIQVPSGSREKHIIRIAEHGLMTSETTRGVLAVVLKYDYSTTMSEEQKKILMEYLNTKKKKR